MSRLSKQEQALVGILFLMGIPLLSFFIVETRKEAKSPSDRPETPAQAHHPQVPPPPPSHLQGPIKTHQTQPKAPPQQEKEHSIPIARRWDRFNETFGPDLKPLFSHDGKLISIEGLAGRNQTGPDFQSDDPQKVLKRASQILDAAKELLDLKSDWPLEHPQFNGNSVSAQVFYTEFYQGLPIEPMGKLKLDFSSRGELLGLQSDYISDLKVVNTQKLSTTEAAKIAENMISEPTSSLRKAEGGRPIVWVRGNQGRFAFEFSVQGRQVVIDAQTGEVLHKRDRRVF